MCSDLERWVAAIGAMLVATCVAHAAPLTDPIDRPALASPRATNAFLTNVTRAGDRLVAVGERGIVLLSDDAGRSWRQATVPVSVTLTAVQFATRTQGWAVGHSGVVLHSDDAGESWVRQLDGKAAAQLALDATKAIDDANPAVKKAMEAMRQLVEDGPDKPFLDLFFADAAHGYVVGAYGLAFATNDGGKTWRSLINRIDNAKGLHIYAVRGAGNALYLVGEQGLFIRSRDAGETFERIETPYRGTYFALALPSADEIVLAGLKGNAYWSSDQGATWQQSQVPVPVSFVSVMEARDGTLVFVNQAGKLLASNDRGHSLSPLATPPTPPLAAIVDAGDRTLVAVGMLGATRVTMPEKNAETPR
jgi:photosystem II stability/assembly factor-like uncharacterized protein